MEQEKIKPGFGRVRVVLVETSHPGNIGGVARAMKNMRLSRLYLVNPAQFPHAEATSRASGADDLLAQATVCKTLDEALEGCSLVFGASARLRRLDWPQLNARECGIRAAEGSRTGDVALVFGRENSGLKNEEMDRCNFLVHIASNPDFSSLNIAAAVQVLAYEVLMALEQGDERVESREEDLATADEVSGLYNHLEQFLVRIRFLDPANPRQLMRRLRRLFNRAALEKTEVHILRGILTEAGKRLKD